MALWSLTKTCSIWSRITYIESTAVSNQGRITSFKDLTLINKEMNSH